MFTGAWRDCHNRTIQACETNRLFIQQNWLFMQKPVRVWHAYIKHRTFWFTYQNRLILYLEWCKQEILSNAYTKTFVICNAPSYCVNVFHVYRPTVFSGSRACSATLFAVSRWKRACSRTENYGKVSKATCIRIDIIRTYRFQSIRKNYIVKFTTITECIISWLSVLYALNDRKVTVWILCRYKKMWDLTYLTSIYIISSVWV